MRDKTERTLNSLKNVTKEFETIINEFEEVRGQLKEKKKHKHVKSLDFNNEILEKNKIELNSKDHSVIIIQAKSLFEI